MSLRRLALFFIVAAVAGFCCCNGAVAQRVMWWNLENLFDVGHDTLKQDLDFTPDGSYHWTPGRYWRKLDNVAKVVAAVAEDKGWPMMIGVCEVENDTVLRDLTLRCPLRIARYGYVHHEGPDVRGIDVALLYQPKMFEVVRHCAIRVPSEQRGLRPTRDILHVEGRRLPSGDSLHVFVVHFPSRAGGHRASSENRALAMATLCNALDSVKGKDVLLMGDFNAESGAPVFVPLLQRMVSLVPQDRKSLRRPEGTYCYQGVWGYIDHIFASASLVSKESGRRQAWRAEVVKFPFLLSESGIPLRTFRGPSYQGGYSDHLPLYVDFRK